MTQCFALSSIILLLTSVFTSKIEQPFELNEYVAEIMGGEENAIRISRSMGFRLIRKLHGHTDTYQLELLDTSLRNVSRHGSRVRRSADVMSLQHQVILKRTKRDFTHWNDEKYPEMWYLNRGANGVDADMNVQEAWQLGYSGKDIIVTIMDDGIDYTHPDLSRNYDQSASADINGDDSDPMPNVKDKENKHGTRCAGQVAAVGNNSICVVGVAFNARIGGIRMLDGWITDRVEAESLSFNRNYIDIYSGSWGPDDTGLIYEGPGLLASEAFYKGVTTGRRGLGNVYVWASGNGGKRGDSCAADGYASSIYTLSVSSVSEHNTRPWYLERCASTMISTYSSGGPNEKDVVTTDLNHACTLSHTGTSASAPLAAGMIALLLEANPRLTWRDVQYVTVLTANADPFVDGNFHENAAGHRYSYYYGFGLMDAGKLVRLGELWRTLPKQHRCASSLHQLNRPLKDLFTEEYAFNFSGCFQPYSGASRRYFEEVGEPVVFLEHVQLNLSITYGHRGLMRVCIVSPSGTISEVMPTRIADASSNYSGSERWPLMTVEFWGEPAAGEWKVVIDNKEGYSQLLQWPSKQPDLKKMIGRWNYVYLIAMGTETFPIRLRPPNPIRPPPAKWFSNFQRYVVDQNETFTVSYKCHDECATNECWGPGANQCLHGCKHVISESGNCLPECPLSTTPLVSLILHSEVMKKIPNAKPPVPRCDSCWSECLNCLRPSLAYGCTKCMEGTFLAPILSPHGSKLRGDIVALMRGRLVTEPVLVGSCLGVCPEGYVANATNQICEQCEEHCEVCSHPEPGSCIRCAKGYHLENQSCVSGTTLCPPATFFRDGRCENCPIGCDNSSCTKYGLCLVCSTKHRFMFDGYCRSSCPMGFYPAHLLTTAGTFTLQLPPRLDFSFNSWACSACPPGCAQCVPSKKFKDGVLIPRCLVCSVGLKLSPHTGLCISSCPMGYYGRDCLQTCHPLCATCSDHASSCLTCSPGASLLPIEVGENQLLPVMKPKYIHNCVVVCPDYMYEKQLQGERICFTCPPMCQTCSGPQNCTLCTSGYLMNEKTGTCEPMPPCLPHQYLDKQRKSCSNCHSSCARCEGPNPSDCLECHRRSGTAFLSPACLLVDNQSEHRGVITRDMKYAVMPRTSTCMPCCSVNQLLEPHEPTSCMFCLPGILTCASWASVGGGLRQYDLDWGTVAKNHENIWNWITKNPSRLILFSIFLIFTCLSLAFIIYHIAKVRCRKNRRRTYLSRLSRPSTAHRLCQRDPEDGASPMLHSNGFATMHKVNSAPSAVENHNGNRVPTVPHAESNCALPNSSSFNTQMPSWQPPGRQQAQRSHQPRNNQASVIFRKRNNVIFYRNVNKNEASDGDEIDEHSNLTKFPPPT